MIYIIEAAATNDQTGEMKSSTNEFINSVSYETTASVILHCE